MKKIIFFLLIFFLFTSKPNYSFSSINNEVMMKVGNQIISSYELKNKIKTKLFLSNEELSQENINRYKTAVLDSLIKLKLMEIELDKFKIKIQHNNKSNSHLEEIAKRYDTNVPGLKTIFENNSLDFEDFKNEINIHQAWKGFVYRTHKNKISINQEEIEFELNNIVNKQKNLEEYNLAEIEVEVKNNSEIKTVINSLQIKIKEIGFEDAAVKFSSASTALNNGNLGWINKKILSKNIQDVIGKLNKGEVSKPIIKGNSILFLKLIDKRVVDVNDVDVVKLRRNITYAKQNELLNIFSNNYLSKLRNNTFIKINE